MNRLKLYIFLTIVITLCVQTGCGYFETEAESPKPPADPAVIAESISQSEAFFKQREDPAKIKDAIAVLAKVRNDGERNFDIEWRFAKYNYFLGKQTLDKKQAVAIFKIGRDAGKIAAKLAPDQPDGHFWYGANLGELTLVDPLGAGIGAIGTVQTEMNKVIEIQPDYQKTSAYDGLAQVELETQLVGGSPKKAAELLEKALETEKDNVNLHLRLATAYLDLKRDADARRELETIIQMKPDPEYMVEYRDCVAAAKKLLASRFGS